MSPQKKPAAKPIVKKASRIKSRAVPGKVLKKVSAKPMKKAPGKLSPPGNSSDHLAEAMIDTIGAGIYLVQKGKVVSVSPVYEKLTGYVAIDLIGKNLLDHVHPDDRPLVRKNTISSLKKKNPDPYEYRFIRKNGEIMWILETVSLIVHQGAPATLGSVMDITRYKQTPDTIELTEERYRTILEDIDEGYFEIDLKGNVIFVNDASCRDLGYSREELIGMHYRQLTDEASAQRMFELYEDLYKMGQSFKGIEVVFITKPGNRRIKEISGALVRDEKRQPIGFRGLTRDVTERRWAEEALLQSEAKYFSIIESIGEAYFETDITGVNTFVNDKVCQDLGYTRDEMLRMSNRDQQDEANARKTYEAFNTIYKTGLPIKDFQYEAIRKDGTKAVYEMSISLMRDAQGKPIGFRGLARDITERKKMEDALRASEERARTIIATIPDPYMESDLRGYITYINTAYRHMMGFSLEELQHTHYRTYMDKENAEAVFDLYNAVNKTGLSMKNVEVAFITKSGEKRLVNLSVGLIRDTQGNPSGFHSIIRDITEKKRAEAIILESEKKLRQYSESLEIRVKERTADLEKSKVAAEAANKAKSDFLANINHELQTPLSTVIGFTKVLQDRMFGELNTKQEEFIRYVAEAGATLSRLITEILEASSITSGRIKLNLSPVRITDALSKMTQLLASQIEERKLTLTVDVALDADIAIEADEQKINHIFYHLMSNAVKYNSEGGKVHVQAARMKDSSGSEGLEIAIQDTGLGIKPEDIPKLFQTFSRLESVYTKESKGIGVGLSLTKQLVEMHGGNIRVESEYGHGSSFTIFLPLLQKQNVSME
jgi:PAS domain S-box-containing protein